MEALRSEDPRRFGRFTVLARFQETASAVRYVARDTGAGETAVITAARPALAAVPAFRRRFEAEARTAERLAGGWVAPPLETGDSEAEGAELLWTAAGYVPALPLADAIGIAGPLPERALRILGAGIAEILSRVHAGGAVLQGLAPDTVLLAGDGPRLTAFGPLGAAATAEARPGGQLSVRLGYLTPEQVAGKEAGAPSDLFVLGLLLAYAATGTTPFTEGPPEEAARRIAEADPELDAVPEELRALIAGCLAKDPAERPTAGTVAAELALEGAAGLARGGWLPERLAAAVAEQEARVRALEGAWEAPAAADSVPGVADAVPAVADAVPETADAVPAVADAVPGNAVPGDAVPQEGGAVGTHAPADPRVPLAPDATHDTGAIGEDRGTTRFPDTGPKPPRSDRATTQLALPHQPPPLPAVPAHQHTHGSPAPYPAAVLPGSAGPGSGQGINGRSGSGQGANGQGGSGGPMVALPLPPAPAPPSGGPALDRRGLLTVAAAAVGGLVVGGGAVAVIGGGESAVATDAKPAAPKPRRTLPGQPPEPRWIYAHPSSESAPLTAALWQDRLLVVTSESQASAVDLRTGKRVWQRADAADGQAALAAGDLCFVAGPTEFLWLAPKDGAVVHRLRYADGFTDLPGLQVGRLAGHSGTVVWFTGSHTVTVKAPKPKKGKKQEPDKKVVQAHLFAYDIVRRAELWRTPVPAGRAPGTPLYRVVAERPADILVRQEPSTLTPADVKAAKGKGSLRCFDRETGTLQWTKQYGTAGLNAGIAGDESGILYASVGADLQSFEADTTKPLWRVAGTEGSYFGTPLVAGPFVHTTERSQQIGAVERETGRFVWRRSTEVPVIGGAPALTVSTTGETLFAADAAQVTAFSAADGERLWKFQDIGVADPKGETVSAPYRALASGANVIVQRARSFYAFPVA
ncbi:PQQ-binding-like beta-propeller repeat protein [Streptomyces cavourensis]|uniref:outer membrane protein assembly factor BamB family protein n=1 Tax=Streptomyces TaxID=1883 RepID=UPI0015867DD7|nr:PQQ-binding-like beta-propeller repeat protein [Streptomyces sp. CAI-24]NUV43056.1 PQQ-binding-like beta-propeller repeat protein [Streptomyces sp. CAI-24]